MIKQGEELHKNFPKHIDTILLIAQVHTKRNHLDKAVERYNKALDLENLNTNARLGKAEALYLQFHYEEALNEYLTLYELSFNTTKYLIKL
ncbi:MAG: hypothetical protein H6765_04940 [Candidatus Peribacteria bacterium]|nr:MAG: hypothetical protein H6765_04940 [Candidatus Peribacteria bacterium]